MHRVDDIMMIALLLQGPNETQLCIEARNKLNILLFRLEIFV
jgi:hypothetical protein